MATVEPIPGEPAAIADIEGDPALIIADVHAGIEAAFRAERGLSLDSRAEQRRKRVGRLLAEHGATRLVVIGDLMHSIGGPGGAERGEIEVLLESLPGHIDVTLVKGNHDGDIESWIDGVTVTNGGGVRLGSVGFVHGHTWPDPDVLAADIVCVGHEHPQVRLEDEVGGSRAERVWLRGDLDGTAFAERYNTAAIRATELIVCPAFNELVGGTWVNTNDEFLSPFLPTGIADAQAYLLDGARLGSFDSI